LVLASHLLADFLELALMGKGLELDFPFLLSYLQEEHHLCQVEPFLYLPSWEEHLCLCLEEEPQHQV
jgi:hypothetical protein